MATKQRSRPRRAHASRDRGPRYVAPVLDPSWQNPYAPSANERHAQSARRSSLRLPSTSAVGPRRRGGGRDRAPRAGRRGRPVALPRGARLAALRVGFLRRRALARYIERGRTLGAEMLATFQPGGDATERLRLVTVLDRLAATFGVDNVSAFVVTDQGYNAALVPDGPNYSLFVTTLDHAGLRTDRTRRASSRTAWRASDSVWWSVRAWPAVVSLNDDARRSLAGVGKTYRADEVAAASIRYPLGLAGALRKCARQHSRSTLSSRPPPTPSGGGSFSTSGATASRATLSDLDDVELRARALEEW